MMTPIRGCFWEASEPGCSASNACRSTSEALLPGRRCSSWRRYARRSASKFAVLVIWPILRPFGTLSSRSRGTCSYLHTERKLRKADRLGQVIRRAKQIEHHGGGHFERGRANGEGEESEDAILVTKIWTYGADWATQCAF